MGARLRFDSVDQYKARLQQLQNDHAKAAADRDAARSMYSEAAAIAAKLAKTIGNAERDLRLAEAREAKPTATADGKPPPVANGNHAAPADRLIARIHAYEALKKLAPGALITFDEAGGLFGMTGAALNAATRSERIKIPRHNNGRNVFLTVKDVIAAFEGTR